MMKNIVTSSASCMMLMAAPAFVADAPLHAQSVDTAATTPGTTAASPASGQVNGHFTYPDIALWNAAPEPAEQAKIDPILNWIAANQELARPLYQVKAKYRGVTDFVGNPDYNWKSESIADPDIIAPLTRMGLRVDIREGGGGFHIIVSPAKPLKGNSARLPVLIVPQIVEKRDLFWAMNMLVRYDAYNRELARRGDFIIVYGASEKREPGQVFGVIDMIADAYRADYRRIFLDMSSLVQAKAKLANIAGLDWPDANGAKRDPDAQIERLGTIPVLNVSGKWTAKSLPGLVAGRPRSDLRFDPQRIVHGMLGERIAAGARFVRDHGEDDDPAIKAHFARMGLIVDDHDETDDRWIIASPRNAVEKGSKLPLVLILTETYPYNRYALSSAYAQYADYFRLAAEGKLNVLLFARETPDTMDRAYAIVRDAQKRYPVDPARIYVTGHSHNGHLAREFAYRHPDMVAAVAPLGNSSGLAAPAYSHEAVVADDSRIAAWSRIDMPIVTIGAASEVTSPHTMPSSILNDYDLFIEAWQRRLTASRIPMKSRDEIMAAERSDDHVTRIFGLPNDGSALQVIDGVEHYIIDLKNVEGRKHLRIVGVDNMVHMVEPTMAMTAWTFMSRFARDQNSGKVIELY